MRDLIKKEVLVGVGQEVRAKAHTPTDFEAKMASCNKCGKQKIKRLKDGRRFCPRCGFHPMRINGKRLSRTGAP